MSKIGSFTLLHFKWSNSFATVSPMTTNDVPLDIRCKKKTSILDDLLFVKKWHSFQLKAELPHPFAENVSFRDCQIHWIPLIYDNVDCIQNEQELPRWLN